MRKLFIDNWPRKLIALLAAVLIWFIVHHLLTTHKTFPNVLVRVVNMPEGMTLQGMGSDGFLTKRVTLRITGSKNVLDYLTASQLEVILNAENKPQDWKVHITKDNLVLVGAPEDALKQNITAVSHPKFELHFIPVKTAKIPVTITKPSGKPPGGWQYTGIFPKKLFVTVKGSETQLQQLTQRGLHLTFDLDLISKSSLDDLLDTRHDRQLRTIGYKIPNEWKKLRLPFAPYSEIEIDDPNHEILKIHFLKQELLPLGRRIPISLFYPSKITSLYNPEKISLKKSQYVVHKNGLDFLDIPLYAMNISQLFLDVVRDQIQLVIEMDVDEGQNIKCIWALDFVNLKRMEKTYINKALTQYKAKNPTTSLQEKMLTQKFHSKFHSYIRFIELYVAPNKPLTIDIELKDDQMKLIPLLLP